MSPEAILDGFMKALQEYEIEEILSRDPPVVGVKDMDKMSGFSTTITLSIYGKDNNEYKLYQDIAALNSVIVTHLPAFRYRMLQAKGEVKDEDLPKPQKEDTDSKYGFAFRRWPSFAEIHYNAYPDITAEKSTWGKFHKEAVSLIAGILNSDIKQLARVSP
jgi:hypothetical protein